MPSEVISQWNTLIENFQASPQAFYAEVTRALEKRQMPNAKIDRISFNGKSSLVSETRIFANLV